jgi:BASS family bile acid:Na+ symporter
MPAAHPARLIRAAAPVDNPLFLDFVKLTIFTLMLGIGVNLSLGDLFGLERRPADLLRSLLAVVVLVPLVVALLLLVVDLPREVATGLAVLAAAPGAPLTSQRARMAAGSIPYAASLQLTLALLAVVLTPLTLGIFYALFDLATEGVHPLEVGRQVATVQLLPVGIGLAVQRLAPKVSRALGKPLVVLGTLLFLVLVVLLIVPSVRIVAKIGMLPIVAILVMSAAALAIGHLLGGRDVHERAAVAISSLARNVGLALFVATLSGAEKALAPTLVTYMVVGSLVAVPYSIRTKRLLARQEAAGTT